MFPKAQDIVFGNRTNNQNADGTLNVFRFKKKLVTCGTYSHRII